MPQDLTNDKSTLVQVMAWCHQATSHYLSQCWLSSLTPYGVARPQWVNTEKAPVRFHLMLIDSNSTYRGHKKGLPVCKVFKSNFFKLNLSILIKISVKCLPKVPVHDRSALVQFQLQAFILTNDYPVYCNLFFITKPHSISYKVLWSSTIWTMVACLRTECTWWNVWNSFDNSVSVISHVICWPRCYKWIKNQRSIQLLSCHVVVDVTASWHDNKFYFG